MDGGIPNAPYGGGGLLLMCLSTILSAVSEYPMFSIPIRAVTLNLLDEGSMPIARHSQN